MDNVNSTTPENEVPGVVHFVLLCVLYGFVFIVGIPGNSLVILAVLVSKKLHTATNAFVVNLSVADLLTCLAIPLYVFYVGTGIFRIGDMQVVLGGLEFATIILDTTLGCSILTMMCIALNRWLLISRPQTTYRKVYTPIKIALWLMFVWVIPFVYLLVLDLLHATIFNVGTAIVLFPVPLTIIIVCYVLIWRRVNRQVRKLAGTNRTPEVSNKTINHPSTETQLDDIPSPSHSTQPHAPNPTTTGNHQLICRHQTQITKNMFYVVCAFVPCVSPSAVLFCLPIEKRNILPYHARKFILVFLYIFAVLLLSSCINPLIYATKHRDFKAVFRCIVRRQWDNIPEPSDFLKAVTRRSKCCRRGNPV